MNEPPLHPVGGNPSALSEADLHAFVDGRLTAEERARVEHFLSTYPQQAEQVRDWQQQNAMLRSLLDPVLDEVLPSRLGPPSEFGQGRWRGIAAGVAIAVASFSAAWFGRGGLDAHSDRIARAEAAAIVAANDTNLSGFAERAAIAHVVYSPDVRRPVEVGADEEQSLVAWLTKRMGADVKPPTLKALGYELIGGRLLPGEKGPVAQFMYGSAQGVRLTLYVTREVSGQDEGFRFGHDGSVNVLYWVDRHFGYAISAGEDRDALVKVSTEVYRQLGGT